jgi:hypothetical protein
MEQLVSYTRCKPTCAQTGGPRPRLNPRTPVAAVWTPFYRYLVPIAYSISAVTEAVDTPSHTGLSPSPNSPKGERADDEGLTCVSEAAEHERFVADDVVEIREKA